MKPSAELLCAEMVLKSMRATTRDARTNYLAAARLFALAVVKA